MTDPPLHPLASFWLDIADKLIKLAAVFIGALWTWWNFRKSRTYEQRLDLKIAANAVAKDGLFGDVRVEVKNIGATKHVVQHTGTFCELAIVRDDLTEEIIELFRVFTSNIKIEPGEVINDTKFWHLSGSLEQIVWVKLTLRVVSNGVEWRSVDLIRVLDQEHP
jgi:hypothetical protein